MTLLRGHWSPPLCPHRPCPRKTNGDSSRVRAVTTHHHQPPAARLAAPTHSVSGWQDSSLTHTHVAQSPIFPGSPPTLPEHGLGPHMVTTSPHGCHLHSGPTLHIQSTCKDYNTEFIWYINRISVFATNIWWYCCWPMNVVTKLRNAKYVFVHLHSVFDCPSPSHSAAHFFCWWWRK